MEEIRYFSTGARHLLMRESIGADRVKIVFGLQTLVTAKSDLTMNLLEAEG